MSRVIALIAVLAVATPAAAYVAMPSTLLRSTGAGMRLSARKGLSSVPTMQLNPSDKSFRRATVALRAEGEEEANGPMGGGPLGSQPGEFTGMPSQESVNPAYFVIGGIMGCIPIAYWLVVSCQVSIGTKLAQCAQ